MGTCELLQHWPGSGDVDRDLGTRHVGIAPQRGSIGGQGFSLVIHFVAGEQRANDLDTLPHHYRWTYFLALFAFADFLHENLGRAKTEKEASIAGGLLHDPRFHGNLNRMA